MLLFEYDVTGQAVKTIEAHEKTITSSKELTYLAIDFLVDSEFRQEIWNYFNNS
jgi:hypothetical protein